MTESDKAREFWKWFSQQENLIIHAVASSDDEWLRNEMTTRVLSLLPEDHVGPRINWQIARGRLRKWQFCLSPLVKENLPLTRQIMSLAPSFEDWEMLSAKPPRPLVEEYKFVDQTGTEHTIHFSEMEYILTEYSGARFSFDLVGEVPIGVDDAIKQKAAYLIIEGLFGEEFVLDHVIEARLHEKADVDPTLPRTKLQMAKRHLGQLLAK